MSFVTLYFSIAGSWIFDERQQLHRTAYQMLKSVLNCRRL